MRTEYLAAIAMTAVATSAGCRNRGLKIGDVRTSHRIGRFSKAEWRCEKRHGEVRQPMKCLVRFVLSALGIVTLVNVSDAAEAPPPQQLLGKSVVVTWSESRVQRNEGEAKFKSVHATQNMSLYIGTSGRVFSRMTFTTGLGSGRAEHIQEQSADPKFRERATTFSGQSMTVDLPFRKGGMRRLLIDFGDKFDNCSAKSSYVTEAGSPTSIGRSPITKKMVEFQSISMSDETCSVLSRNVFGDE